MVDYIFPAFVGWYVARTIYKSFIEPGWMKSQTRKNWKGVRDG
jgi:hypothetical protein